MPALVSIAPEGDVVVRLERFGNRDHSVADVVSTSPNLPRSPIILVQNQTGRGPTACSGSMMRVHVIVLPLSVLCIQSAEVRFTTPGQSEGVSQIAMRMRQKSMPSSQAGRQSPDRPGVPEQYQKI
jgi:hypothetical protein